MTSKLILNSVMRTIVKTMITKRKRRIRITRKQRQLRFLTILLVLGAVILNNLPKSTKTATAFLDNYEQVAVTIKSGDRAWNIQSELTPGIDVRNVLYHVNLINDKSIGNIKPGEQIIFLKVKDN